MIKARFGYRQPANEAGPILTALETIWFNHKLGILILGKERKGGHTGYGKQYS